MIVAFTKDWDDVPTCTTHVLREMAKTMPVLWVSSIGTRKPSAASGKDLRRIVGRIRSGLKRAEWKENSLRVLKPILIPKAETAFAKWLNRKLFAWYVRREKRDMERGGQGPTVSHLKPESIEFWCFVPNAVDLLPRTKEGSVPCIVYYCADDWGQFHNLDGAWMDAKERELVQRADVVFVTSRFLERKLSGFRSHPSSLSPSPIHYLPHGVEYARFSQALDKSQPIPADVAGLPKPVIGFYGNLHPWVDLDVVAFLAASRAQWSFVLIGEIYTNLDSLESLPNVHLLGRREHCDLHTYCRAFDVAIIPYDMSNPRMESVNPVKTKELLGAGLPIVASEVPELRNYGDDVLTCEGNDAWLSALDRQVARRDQTAISERVRNESWENKVATIRRIVDDG